MRSPGSSWGLSWLVVAGISACSIEGPGPESEPADQPTFEGGRDLDRSRPDDAQAEPIKGGSEATTYPEAVLVNMKKNGYQVSSCSGSVIAPRLVLTAGHCVVGFDGWDLVAPFANGQTASSTEAMTYDWTDNGNYVNPNQHDVGVIVLAKDIVLGQYPAIASSPVASGTKVLNIGRKINGYLSNSKLYVSQPVSVSSGNGWGFPYAYASTEIIEPGDSGGPDVLPGSAPHTIVAVNSGAGSGWQILARVDLVHAWIQTQIADHGGSTPPPDPPPDPCSGVSYAGQCNGAVLTWCENDQLQTIDCGANGMECAWDANYGFYNCL